MKKTMIIPGLIALVIVSIGLGLLIGRVIWHQTLGSSAALRLGGYDFIKPLLVCSRSTNSSGLVQPIQSLVEAVIKEKVAAGDITTASVYFRRLESGDDFEIGGEEKFSPASLRKVPLLMALYKTVESNPNLLTNTKVEVSGDDQNQGQEIMPKMAAHAGETYTVADLAEKMIVNSDNNSASILVSLIGEESLPDLFAKLQIPYVHFDKNFVTNNSSEFITARSFSLFLRVLYNATYLNNDLSEKAMKLMSKVDYQKALVAGVPTNIPVAHKFGLWTEKASDGIVVNRELHDCGIVYDPTGPYILCVMTKSKAELPRIENTIKAISETVYTANSKI